MLDKQTILEAFGVDTRKPQDLVQFARQEATDLGIDPDVAERLINVESGGNPNAVSKKGAFGPAQLMPGTARDLATKYGGDPADPHDNIRLGLRYLRDNLNEFDGDYTLASAAYHAGPGAVRRAGGVPNTSDGRMRTSDYSAAVAGGAHTLVKEHDLRDYGDEDPLLTLAQRWTPMYAETPEATAEEQKPKTSTAGDLGHALKIGWTIFAQDLAEVVKRVPLVGQPIYDLADKFDQWRTGQTTDDLLKGDIKEQFGRISPEMQKASQEKWWDEEKGWFGPAMTDWRSWAYGLTTNLPEQAGMMLPAMKLAKAAYAAKAGSMLADGTFTAIAERELAAGVTREAAATAAAQEVMKVAGKSAAAAAGLGGGTIEGLLGGAQSSRQVRDELMAAPEDALLKFDSYKALVANGMSPQEARKALAEDRATQAFILSGVATGLFAGMGDRLMAKVWTGNLEGGVLKRFLYGGTVEALPEEFPQDYLQQVAENYALQKPLTEGALNQAVAGAAMAFVQGGAFAVPFGPQSIQRPPTVDDTLTRIKDATTTDEAIAAATEHVNINSDVARQDLNESLRQQWEMRNAAEAEAAIQAVAETRVEAQAVKEEEAVTAAVRQEQAVKEAPPQAQYETTMRAIEARGGQATHAEAALLARAGQGAPYDFIIDSPKVAGTSLSSISTERLESLKKLAGNSDTAARIADEIAIRSAGQFAADIATARTAGQEADHTGEILFSGQRDRVDHQAIVNAMASKYNTTAQVIPATVLSNEKVQQIPGVITPGMHHTIELAANLVGKDLVLYAVEGRSTDGFVVPGAAPNTVYMNVATKDASPVAVFWHEITHHMEREEPQLFQALRSALKEEGVLKDTTTTFLEGQEQLSPEGRFNEIIGDLTGNAMTVPETWHSIFSRIADHETVRKIADYIKRMLGHFIRRSNLKQFEDTGRLVNDVRKVQKAVAEAVSQYVERKKAKEAKNETETPQEDRDQHLPGAAAEDRQSAQREAPAYGKESPASVSVVGTHYSRIGRTRLSGQYFGSGLKGAERSRLDNAPAILRDRLYFYVDEGKGTFPEEGVGAFAHTTNLTNLYDAVGDPLSLWNSKDNNGSELAILNAGFDGYYVRGAFGNQGVAVLIGKHYDVPTQAVGTGSQGPSGQVAPPVKTNPIRAMATRLAQSRSLPDGELDMGSWERILESLDPEIADILKTKGVFNEPGKFYKSELAARLLRPASVQESAQRQGEMDTRVPTSKKEKHTTKGVLVPNLKAMKAAPEMFEKNIALVTQSLMYREADTYNTPEKQAERFVQVATKNLLWLHDQFPEKLRARAKLWYVGANKLANEAAKKYGITPEQAAAVYATMSPQLDWFRNVDLGDRILDTWFNHKNEVWTPAMDTVAERLLYEDQITDIAGRSLAELRTDLDRARWVRVFDEATKPRQYHGISPEGDRIGWMKTLSGADSQAGWMNGFGPMAKAISVLENGSLDNISRALGSEPKVRNFYNNILVPNSEVGHITVDTHAVAAAHLLPLAGSSREVLWNFGKAKAGFSAYTGISGTYPLYYEAYTRAAKERGVLPREMQSITWEAVRGLFPWTWKRNQNNVMATNDAWSQYRKGRASLETTRQRVLDIAGGITTPSWAGSGDRSNAGAEDTVDSGGIPEGSLRERGSAGRIAESAQRALFEVAPNPDNAEQYARWAALPREEQLRISRSVADDVVPRILSLLGAKGSVSIQFGGYEGTHNISFAINLESGDIDRVSKAIGYVLDQKSMVTIGGKEGSPAGAVLVTVPDATFASVSDIYTRLWTQAQIVGHTTVGNTMTILNDGSVPLSDLENSIRGVLGDEFDISTDPEASASFPSSEEYGIEKESKYVKSVLDSLRSRAAVAVDAGKVMESGQRFYSKLQRVISELPPKLSSQPAAQWVAWLNSNAAKLGVKKDEIYWSGVEEFLRMQQGKVSKEQVVDYLENNGVRVEETVLSNDNLDTRMPEGFKLTNAPNGGVRLEYNDGDTRIVVLKNTFTSAAYEMQERLSLKARRVQLDEADDSTASERLFSAAEAMDTLMEDQDKVQPKFERYVLPGGTNYREVLLTLPGKEVFQSSHWDRSNVLAHLRVDDRMDSDGGKVLFVEEVQSDWGQKGKKEGFNPPQEMWVLRDPNGRLLRRFESNREHEARILAEEEGATVALEQVSDVILGVPNAPFVTKTENWVTLALKRVIQMAVDGGYDKVAFVNGEQSADRYDLSKQVDSISYRKNGEQFRVLARPIDGGEMIDLGTVDAGELDSVVGKEVANKILDNKGELAGDMTILRGVDLKIGGEGMRTFYDKIVPQVANGVLKKFGGEKIGMVSVPIDSADEGAIERDVPIEEDGYAYASQPGFTISKQLKDSVSGGMPLFSAQRGIYQAAHLKHLTQAQVDMINHVVGEPLTWRERVDRLVANAGIKLSQGIADQFAPIKEISYKGYMLARMSKGSDGTLEAALLHGIPRLVNDVFHIDTTKGGFLELLKPLGGEQDLFFLWVAGLRAEQLARQGKENLFRPQDIVAAKSLNQGTMPDGRQRSTVYAKALRGLQEFQKAFLDIAEARGIIDGASRHVWESQFYVPFYRNMEDGTTGPSIKSGLVNQYAFKKLKGSSKQLHEDLMANTLMNWAHLLSASAKNVAAKESIDATVALGAAYPVPSGTKGSVSYLENGDEKHFRIEDPFILDAVSALSFGSFNDPLSKLMGTMKRYLTIGVTAMPQFKIRNLIRDSISSIAQTDLSYNIAGNVVQGLKASNPKSQTYIDMLANGGLIRFGTMLDGNRADYTRRLLEKGIPADSILDTAHKVTGVLETIWEKYKDLGDRFENANRAALYEQLRAKGVSELEANYQARDLLDFSMGGSWKAVRYLSQITPFFNARIQGLYKLGREGKENPAKLAVVLGAVVMYSMALMAAYHDDDDWKKREDWDRDNYWWFKFAGQAYRIPKPFELGAVATLAERTAELLFDQEMDGKRFGERVGSLLSNNLSLIQLPQLIKPLVDVYANKDSFTGRQIESMGLENLPSAERKSGRTSNVAELLGELGLPNPVAAMQGQYDPLSPVKIDFLIRGYFGGLGTSVLAAVDVAANPFRDRPEPPEKQLRDTFLVGSFVESLPTNSSRYVSHFYQQAKEVNEAYALYQSRLKIGDLAEAQAVMAENESKLKLHHGVSEVSRLMGSLNLQIRRVEASRELTPQAKRSLIDEIRARQDTLARSVSSPAQ